MNFDVEMKERVHDIEARLQKFLPEEAGYQKTVFQAMNYSVNAGGKRLRPMLMLEVYHMFGGTDETLIEPFVAAIEMIHTYSLVHDDLPALDNDEYRRGKKTTWAVYGDDMAVLAGDALLNYAFETAVKAFDVAKDGESFKAVARALQLLTQKPGIYGMIGGQVVDVELSGCAPGKGVLDFIYLMKTSALIECAMMVGAVLAGADEASVKTIEAIARKTGLAFQIEDDILDVTSSLEVLGKPIHSDEKNEKTTYVTLYGIEGAQKEVERLSAEAIDSLRKFGGADTFLEALLVYLIHRKK